jgi:hypothetical protein
MSGPTARNGGESHMTLSDLAAIGSFISGMAVLVSLIFLYFQLRQVNTQVMQSERNQQASIRAARASRIIDLFMGSAHPSVAEAVVKGMRGFSDMSETQVFQFISYGSARFFNAEDSFYQHREGLLNEYNIDAVTNGLRTSFASPGMRTVYKRSRVMMGREFVEFADQLLAATPVAAGPDLAARFMADLAAELAGAGR